MSDLHRQWHQAEEAYFDPEAFRVAIQTAIQTARTVSFILQSNKALIPDFDAWYLGWRDRLKAIPLMRWMVDARNRIEKQGDLETYSWIHAEILASHLHEGPREVVKTELFDGPKKLLDTIPKDALGDHIRRDGILRIERRWVENSLPDYELLDAVAIAYGHLAQLVSDAHRQLGLCEPTVTMDGIELPFDRVMTGGRLPCMIGHNENRQIDIWLATGKILEFEQSEVSIDEDVFMEAAKRYNIDPDFHFNTEQDILSQAKEIFLNARKLFLRDGYHIFLVMIFKNGKPIYGKEVRLEEHGHKYVFMRSLANDVLRMGGDAVIAINEAWMGTSNPKNPYQRVRDAPGRKEVLTATLVAKDGPPLNLMATIRRNTDRVSLDDTIEATEHVPYMFASIYEVWGLKVPGSEIDPSEHDGRQYKPNFLRALSERLLSSTSFFLKQ
ncbi:hypothetical protein [Methylobacterium sp. 77]|uniref:hypothetical protein n=1 Tax=Methylobacterium sp. 77 TaxID=1101192 RepID=UPI0018CAEB9D|nr:hypothetical protein [Methylobacterium sp. 77]